jgi:hypothetical protein
VYYKRALVFDVAATQKQLLLYPILGVIVLLTLLSLPVITWLSLLPTIFYRCIISPPGVRIAVCRSQTRR